MWLTEWHEGGKIVEDELLDHPVDDWTWTVGYTRQGAEFAARRDGGTVLHSVRRVIIYPKSFS